MLKEIQRKVGVLYMRDNLVRQENSLWKRPDCVSKFENHIDTKSVDIKRMGKAHSLFQYKN